MVNVLSRECKFVLYLPKNEGKNEDTHFIKERVTYSDGRVEDNLKVLSNFERPFWITKPHFQKHKDKKESEELDKLNMFKATQSDLPKAIAARLGGNRWIGKKTMRDMTASQYLYGTDVDTRTIIKHMYKKKYPNANTPNRVAALDIETDTETDEILVITVANKDNIFTAILSRLIPNKRDIENQLQYLFDKYIPRTEFNKDMKPVFAIFENEMEVIEAAINKLHEWKDDFAAVWNINYDIPHIVKRCQKHGVDPKYIFSEPSLPNNLKYFNYKEGSAKKTTDSGKNKPKNPHELWHIVNTPAYHYWIDAMCAYNFVREGSKQLPGGYSLNNVLQVELGSRLKKLKFEDEVDIPLDGLEWHQYMVKNKPLEYIIYNIWDVMSMLELDNKTLDLKVSISALAGDSPYEIFNSGPRKIVNALHFYYLDNKKVLGVRPPVTEEVESLGLHNWINILEASYIKDNYGNRIIEDNNLTSNIKTYVFDLDRKANKKKTKSVKYKPI